LYQVLKLYIFNSDMQGWLWMVINEIIVNTHGLL